MRESLLGQGSERFSCVYRLALALPPCSSGLVYNAGAAACAFVALVLLVALDFVVLPEPLPELEPAFAPAPLFAAALGTCSVVAPTLL